MKFHVHWSHKPGANEVSRLDGQNGDQNLILDPQNCDRADYTIFVGYFAIAPWYIYP